MTVPIPSPLSRICKDEAVMNETLITPNDAVREDDGSSLWTLDDTFPTQTVSFEGNLVINTTKGIPINMEGSSTGWRHPCSATFKFNGSLFATAERIATEHHRRGWFEKASRALARKIKLRSAIYEALADAHTAGAEA